MRLLSQEGGAILEHSVEQRKAAARPQTKPTDLIYAVSSPVL